jgi:HAE1 family hydrophobic/amphiphilic exporter-1
MLPAAIGLGPGVETNRPLSLVVMGGMVSSTLLTLVVVPAVYSLVEGAREHRRQHGTVAMLRHTWNRIPGLGRR